MWLKKSYLYRPETKLAKVMFLHLSVSHSVHGGGGMHGGGACVVGGMHGRGHMWAGGHAWQGACVAVGMRGQGSMHGRGPTCHPSQTLRDTVGQ